MRLIIVHMYKLQVTVDLYDRKSSSLFIQETKNRLHIYLHKSEPNSVPVRRAGSVSPSGDPSSRNHRPDPDPKIRARTGCSDRVPCISGLSPGFLFKNPNFPRKKMSPLKKPFLYGPHGLHRFQCRAFPSRQSSRLRSTVVAHWWNLQPNRWNWVETGPQPHNPVVPYRTRFRICRHLQPEFGLKPENSV